MKGARESRERGKFSRYNRADRRKVIDEAIANNRLAGLELHPDDRAFFEKFVEGEMSWEELRKVIRERYPAKK